MKKISADQGNCCGQYNYALMNEHGLGTPKNSEIALKYCQMSADQGYSIAQFQQGFSFIFKKTKTRNSQKFFFREVS